MGFATKAQEPAGRRVSEGSRILEGECTDFVRGAHHEYWMAFGRESAWLSGDCGDCLVGPCGGQLRFGRGMISPRIAAMRSPTTPHRSWREKVPLVGRRCVVLTARCSRVPPHIP